MPRLSQCQERIETLQQLLSVAIVFDNWEKAKVYIEELCWVLESRYHTPRINVPRDDHIYTHKFSQLTDGQFRRRFRTTRNGFMALVSLIQDHRTFKNRSNYKQAHPGWQLAVALHRFGNYGRKMSVAELAVDFEIGEGTVMAFTRRVIEALTDLSQEWIVWPDEERREEIRDVMRGEGFPGCIGFIGGTTIPLSQKPAINGAAYWDQKYSINAQIVCDVDKRIISFDIGSPGSCADSTAYKRMEICVHPEYYFAPAEYLLADSAYALSTTCIPAYKSPQANSPENAMFNIHLARSRGRNEHCIGILKGRWCSLKEMRQQIRSVSEMETLVQWIHSCCVLHNMLMLIGDSWEEQFCDRQPYSLYRSSQPSIEVHIPRNVEVDSARNQSRKRLLVNI